MRTEIVQGSKEVIADRLSHIRGNIVEAIFFVDDSGNGHAAGRDLSDADFEALLREMDAHTVSVGNVDYSRESIYRRMEGE